MIWAVALAGNVMYTGGDDQRLIKWDYRVTKKWLKEVKCPYKIRAIDVNNKQNILVVGFYNGAIMMYDADTLERQEKLFYTKIKNPDQEVLNIVRL
jgi:hypothetical protein